MSGFQGETTTSFAFAVGQISATRTATPTLLVITVNYLATTY